MLIFDPDNGKNVDFFYINAIEHDSLDKPYVGNLTKGLESVGESNKERKKVRGIKITRPCVLDALIFDLQNIKNGDFFCINAIKMTI